MERHLVTRRDFGVWFLTNMTDLPRIIWTDEKKFILDGPDTYGTQWSQSRSTHSELVDSFGARGVMVHLAFSCDGLAILTRIHGILDGKRYAHLIERHVLPVVQQVYGPNFMLQQDNAPIHVSRHAKEMFDRNKVDLMRWPPLSPDLSPVENLFGILSRMVYEGGRQYHSEESLWQALQQAGTKIPIETYKTLAQSVPKWVSQMVRAGGERFQK